MLERIKGFFFHSAVHALLYAIPRFVYTLLVRIPVTLWELITSVRPFSFQRERHITVVTSTEDTATASRLMTAFGITKTMQYTDYMYSGHIHTLVGGMRVARRVNYERELLDAEDGNPICLDWLRVPEGTPARGVLLVVPGIGNYGQSPYIQRLARECVRRGMHCCVLTPRGMGSAPLTTPRLTCVTFTSDVRTTLRKRFQKDRMEAEFGANVPLVAVGYSGGACTLVITMAEEMTAEKEAAAKGEPPVYPKGFPVSCCVSMSAPYDMVVSTNTMLSKVGMALYQTALLTSLRKYALKHSKVFIAGIPGLPKVQDEQELRGFLKQMPTVAAFDEHVVAPHFGYASGDDYHRAGSVPPYLPKTGNVPIVCVAARDDPITGYGVTAEEWQGIVNKCPNVIYVETPVGGHLGYLLGPVDEYKEKTSFLDNFPLDLLSHYSGQVKKSD